MSLPEEESKRGTSETSNQEQSPSRQEEKDENDRPSNNDFVIREGFPALLRPDGKGPLVEGDEPIPSSKFASYKNALQVAPEHVDSLLEDCSTVFSARTKDDGAAYSVGCTYFVPCQMKPRCALEALALKIFETHVAALQPETKDGQSLMYDPERSGAEWWTLVMDAEPPKSDEDETKKADEEHTEDEDDDEVGMHFDADYGLESQLRHMMLHPRVATVTYLSNVGAPTVVLNRRSPPFADVARKSLSGDIKSAWLSGPQFGKHMYFDGRLLHGAPAAFFPGDHATKPFDDVNAPPSKRQKLDGSTRSEKSLPKSPSAEKRVTFLVNVWINHCPMEAELLDDEVCKELKTPWDDTQQTANEKTSGEESSPVPPFEWKLTSLNDTDQVQNLKLAASASDPAGSEETVVCHREVTINFGATLDDLHKSSQQTIGGESIELELGAGAISIVVGEEIESSDEEED